MKDKRTFLQKLAPRDIIAVLMLGGAFYLKLNGADGTVSMVIAAIVGYYLSKRVAEEARAK